MAGATTTINAASKALAVALQDYLDGLNAGTVVKFVPVPGWINGVALDTGDFPKGFGTAGDATRLVRVSYTIRKNSDAAANMIYDFPGVELGRWPLFWKIVASGSESLADS